MDLSHLILQQQGTGTCHDGLEKTQTTPGYEALLFSQGGWS
jgi:hypothetical protein